MILFVFEVILYAVIDAAITKKYIEKYYENKVMFTFLLIGLNFLIGRIIDYILL